jgi:hypothetical protein
VHVIPIVPPQFRLKRFGPPPVFVTVKIAWCPEELAVRAGSVPASGVTDTPDATGGLYVSIADQ